MIKLINFFGPGEPLVLKIMGVARNNFGDHAFVSLDKLYGFNRPTNIKFGPDAWIADYGPVRDLASATRVGNS